MDPITNEEDAKYYLGRLYFQKNDYKKAIKVYKEGLAINPQAIILLYEIGLAYSKLKNYKKTLEYWKELLKLAPHSFLAAEARWRFRELKIPDAFFSIKRLQKNVLKLPNSLDEAFERLEIECKKAILEAMIKGIIVCPRWKASTTSTAINRKKNRKSN